MSKVQFDEEWYNSYSLNDIRLFIKRAYLDRQKNPSSTINAYHFNHMADLYKYYKKRGGKSTLQMIIGRK